MIGPWGHAAAALQVLPENLRVARSRRELTLAQVADEVGCSTTPIARLERGLNVTAWTAMLVMQWLAKQEGK